MASYLSPGKVHEKHTAVRNTWPAGRVEIAAIAVDGNLDVTFDCGRGAHGREARRVPHVMLCMNTVYSRGGRESLSIIKR